MGDCVWMKNIPIIFGFGSAYNINTNYVSLYVIGSQNNDN